MISRLINPAERWLPIKPPSGWREGFEVHAQLVCEIARREGYTVFHLPNDGDQPREFGNMRIQYKDVEHTFWGAVPDTVSLVGQRIANNKHLAKYWLREAGVPTPKYELYPLRDKRYAEEAWEKHKRPVVLKPVDGSGGRGISKVTTIKEFHHAWWYCTSEAPKSHVLIEDLVPGRNYRLLVIGGSVVAVAERTPAHVVGDGESTVHRLVDLHNVDRLRNPYLAKSLVRLPFVQEELYHVPKYGEVVDLAFVSNASAGGRTRDVDIQTIHPAYLHVAVKAAAAIPGLPCVGVDLIAPDITASVAENYTILEVNAAPDLGLHHFPTTGTARNVASALLAHVFGREATVK